MRVATNPKENEPVKSKLRRICKQQIEQVSFEFMLIEELLNRTKEKIILKLNHNLKQNLDASTSVEDKAMMNGAKCLILVLNKDKIKSLEQ